MCDSSLGLLSAAECKNPTSAHHACICNGSPHTFVSTAAQTSPCGPDNQIFDSDCLDFSRDAKYFSLTDDATAAGEEGNPNMPFSAKLTNALLMERWSLLSSTVESEMGDRTESMAPAQVKPEP
jgi:hypothetical protein